MKLKKICFVSPNIYPVLTRNSGDFAGGAEFQQTIIGRHIHHNGYEVSFATEVFDDQRQDETIEGMRVYKTFSKSDGWPLFRFFLTKVPRIWKALETADADVYYQRGAAALTGIVALFCRVHGKKFVFSAAHNTNFIPEKINVPYWRDKIFYKWGLRHASHIIVQSYDQKKLLRENFGLDASVAYNVYPRRNLAKNGEYVLWVANIKPMKRPHLLLEIARTCPHLEFKMIGGMVKGHEALYEMVRAEATALNNLEFLGFRPLQATEEFFDRAALFLNTSELEGFPNTFLQAWSRGIPTASFFDPDDLIQKNDLGEVLREGGEVTSILERPVRCSSEYRRHIQEYFDRTHLPERYLKHLDDVIGSG